MYFIKKIFSDHALLGPEKLYSVMNGRGSTVLNI